MSNVVGFIRSFRLAKDADALLTKFQLKKDDSERLRVGKVEALELRSESRSELPGTLR